MPQSFLALAAEHSGLPTLMLSEIDTSNPGLGSTPHTPLQSNPSLPLDSPLSHSLTEVRPPHPAEPLPPSTQNGQADSLPSPHRATRQAALLSDTGHRPRPERRSLGLPGLKAGTSLCVQTIFEDIDHISQLHDFEQGGPLAPPSQSDSGNDFSLPYHLTPQDLLPPSGSIAGEGLSEGPPAADALVKAEPSCAAEQAAGLGRSLRLRLPTFKRACKPFLDDDADDYIPHLSKKHRAGVHSNILCRIRSLAATRGRKDLRSLQAHDTRSAISSWDMSSAGLRMGAFVHTLLRVGRSQAQEGGQADAPGRRAGLPPRREEDDGRDCARPQGQPPAAVRGGPQRGQRRDRQPPQQAPQPLVCPPSPA